MKKFVAISTTVISIIFLTHQFAHAQTMQNFFYSKGVKDLCQAAHVSNDYESGTYNVQDNYVDITFVSKDHVFDRDIYTSLRLVRGAGGLYFTDILILNSNGTIGSDGTDGDIVNPFNAFGLQAALMLSLAKSIDRDSYQQLQQKIIDEFHTDVEQWNGKMWTLFGLNLDYIEYALKN